MEFVLTHAITREFLARLSAEGDDLDALFIDPDQQALPPADVERRVAALCVRVVYGDED